MRVGLRIHLVAGRVDDVILAEQVLSRGIRLRDGAHQLRLQQPVVGIDGGDAPMGISRDDGERAVQLGEERIEGDDRGMEVLFVARQRGIEIAHDVAQVGEEGGE